MMDFNELTFTFILGACYCLSLALAFWVGANSGIPPACYVPPEGYHCTYNDNFRECQWVGAEASQTPVVYPTLTPSTMPNPTQTPTPTPIENETEYKSEYQKAYEKWNLGSEWKLGSEK